MAKYRIIEYEGEYFVEQEQGIGYPATEITGEVTLRSGGTILIKTVQGTYIPSYGKEHIYFYEPVFTASLNECNAFIDNKKSKHNIYKGKIIREEEF